MRIDHIGYAVKNIEKARQDFELLGYKFEELIEDMDRNVYIQFGQKDGYRIELVSPLKTGPNPVDTYLATTGNTPYHICYCSDDLDMEIKNLENQRYKVIIPAKEAIAFGGRRVVFMINKNIGMIEVVEE